MTGEPAPSGTEMYAWKFEDENVQIPVLVVGMGRPGFWEEYGQDVTIVTWGKDEL